MQLIFWSLQFSEKSFIYNTSLRLLLIDVGLQKLYMSVLAYIRMLFYFSSNFILLMKVFSCLKMDAEKCENFPEK